MIKGLKTAALLVSAAAVVGTVSCNRCKLCSGLEAARYGRQKQITDAVSRCIADKKKEKLPGRAAIGFPVQQDARVFAFTRYAGGERVYVAANFSEQPCTYRAGSTTLNLGPYDIFTAREYY
jgi:hypothetical protein